MSNTSFARVSSSAAGSHCPDHVVAILLRDAADRLLNHLVVICEQDATAMLRHRGTPRDTFARLLRLFRPR